MNYNIHKACFDGDLEGVKKFIADGGDINLTDGGTPPPLSCAVIHGHEEVVTFLIKENANVNAIDSWGNSALRFATQFKRENIIKMLVDAGATVGEVRNVT